MFRPHPRDVRRVGFVYLLHFEEPYRHAAHYVGFTEREPNERWKIHLVGRGARLLQVLAAAGIAWRPVRVWRGSRADERRLKLHSATRACPACRARPQRVKWMREVEREAASS